MERGCIKMRDARSTMQKLEMEWLASRPSRHRFAPSPPSQPSPSRPQPWRAASRARQGRSPAMVPGQPRRLLGRGQGKAEESPVTTGVMMTAPVESTPFDDGAARRESWLIAGGGTDNAGRRRVEL